MKPLVLASAPSMARRRRLDRTFAGTPRLSQSALEWLAHGERGLSSEQMFESITGVPALTGHWRNRTHYPHDPSDLRRCILLWELVPEIRVGFTKMQHISPEWKRIVWHSRELLNTFLYEAPGGWRDYHCVGWSAPRTFDLIRKILMRQPR